MGFCQNQSRLHDYLRVLHAIPAQGLRDAAGAVAFRAWADQERAAWLAAVEKDPLLPRALLPPGYVGGQAWRSRVKSVRRVARRIRSFPKLRIEC